MAGVEALYPYIKPYAQGIPDVAVRVEVLLALKELAKTTLAVRDDLYIDAQAGWGMYELDIPEHHHLESVTRVCVNGAEVKALAAKPCDTCAADGYWIDRNKTLQIYPPPWRDETDGIEVEYAYSPALNATVIDEEVIERYASSVASAVLSRVLSMKDQKWYDPRNAQIHAALWERAKVSALVDGASRYTRGLIALENRSENYLDS